MLNTNTENSVNSQSNQIVQPAIMMSLSSEVLVHLNNNLFFNPINVIIHNQIIHVELFVINVRTLQFKWWYMMVCIFTFTSMTSASWHAFESIFATCTHTWWTSCFATTFHHVKYLTWQISSDRDQMVTFNCPTHSVGRSVVHYSVFHSTAW